MNYNRTLCTSGCLTGGGTVVPVVTDGPAEPGRDSFCSVTLCKGNPAQMSAVHVMWEGGVLSVLDLPTDPVRLGLGYGKYEKSSYKAAYRGVGHHVYGEEWV